MPLQTTYVFLFYFLCLSSVRLSYSFLVFSEQSTPYLLRLVGSGPVMIRENAMNMSKNNVRGPTLNPTRSIASALRPPRYSAVTASRLS